MTRRSMLRRTGMGLAGLTALGGAAVVTQSAREQPARRLPPVPIAAPLRIDHVTVIDPRDGSRRVDVSIRIRNGNIVSVSDDRAPDSDEWAVDGHGRYAVPGYNNMHTHALQAEFPDMPLAVMLSEGTTGMRQMAGSAQLLEARAQARLGVPPHAPRLLQMPGSLLMPFTASSVEDVQRQIAEQKHQGADFVKVIDVDREVFFAAVDAAHDSGMRIAGHLPLSVTLKEASEAGMDCIEHLGAGGYVWFETSSDGARLRAEEHDDSGRMPGWLGHLPFADQLFSTTYVQKHVKKMLLNPVLSDSADTVARLRRAIDTFDDDAAQQLVDTFAQQKTWHTPTLVRLRTQYRADDPAYAVHPWVALLGEADRRDYEEARRRFLDLPDATRATYHDCYDMSLRLVGMMHAAGVALMTGTDGTGATPGQGLASEFGELAAAGLEPLDVLRSATTVPAAYLGRTRDLGVVAAGMAADFLLLDADPLSSVANMTRVAAVVRAGRFIAGGEIRSVIDQLAG
ncbi:amidohydrolase family protein [Mycolicibacterium sp. 018/SC-01/001]|uniref:amidohydrolase family protein n=1 Tax=Mycolicibacterium sp. 018/SC-01/001 TaxID=2592069 RepID=UPI00163D5652|nr:amidohydrolase family protein [Mycolicibacterium sp. 018/SC-01/001]